MKKKLNLLFSNSSGAFLIAVNVFKNEEQRRNDKNNDQHLNSKNLHPIVHFNVCRSGQFKIIYPSNQNVPYNLPSTSMEDQMYYYLLYVKYLFYKYVTKVFL
ncbi:hypothetical protein ACKWTF_009299 [Chironomus riparius]